MSQKKIFFLFFQFTLSLISLLGLAVVDHFVGYHVIFFCGALFFINQPNLQKILFVLFFSLLHDVMYVSPLGLTGMVLFGIMTLRSQKQIKSLPKWLESIVFGIISLISILIIERWV